MTGSITGGRSIEEQGVGTLFLALGFLVWREDERPSSKEHHAPLLLLPIDLKRESAGAKFKVSYTRGELTTNLSLQERLRSDFGVELPNLPEEIEDLVPSEYAESIAGAVKGMEGWRVQTNDIVLWEFFFAKIRMFQDLQAGAWPDGSGLRGDGLVSSMLSEGFCEEPPLFPSNEEPIDHLMPVCDTIHVVEADSSQAMVIEECRQGRSLVVQGPPGTGKSQTIANLIASAVREGKQVLFVAEKKAALEVVHRRLDQVGLSDFCLELHSNKASKKGVIAEIDKTLQLGSPRIEDPKLVANELQRQIDTLNRHAAVMSSPVERSGFTPYELVGQITRLRSSGTRGNELNAHAAAKWERQQIESVIRRAGDLQSFSERIGDPTTHPWRGVKAEGLLPTDIDRIESTLERLAVRFEELTTAARDLANSIGAKRPLTGSELSELAQAVQRLGRSSKQQRQLICSPVWRERLEDIVALVEEGSDLLAMRAHLSGRVDSHQLQAHVRAAYSALKANGRSWFRWFSADYRGALATLRTVAADVPPTHLDEQLGLLKSLLEFQDATLAFATGDTESLGKAAFGHTWFGVATNWKAAKELVEGVSVCLSETKSIQASEQLAAALSSTQVVDLLKPIAANLKLGFAELDGLTNRLLWRLADQFGHTRLTAVNLEDLFARITTCRDRVRELQEYIGFHTRCSHLEKAGLADAVQKLRDGEIETDQLKSSVELSLYETLLRLVYANSPEVATFDGQSHEQLRAAFANVDEQWTHTARSLVARRHWDGIPKARSVGEMVVLQREINKKARHLSIRKLITKAGRAMQRIKPVFMMSPISVAQYLPPGEIDFDLLVIDEASQVTPEDAIGAMARAKQLVVVGDSKQLPPTNFFGRSSTDDGDPGQADEDLTSDLESVLGLCCSKGMTQRMLRWHYRSRHHSLITFSNHEFYDSRLYVVPSPAKAGGDTGVEFRHLPDTAYGRGDTQQNRGEAEVIAAEVMRHARDCPNISLGVAAFSVKQRDAILDELEILRRKDTSTEVFFGEGRDEPFFVKNLENIQGDERDVILISVGYGRDADGYLSMSFGPLNNDGGERRLNVLITRARSKCVVFANFTADDIDLARTKATGVVALKGYLRYAQHGLLDTDTPPELCEYDSEFERQVAVALRQRGVETHAQIGAAGFRIDLAVVDPEQPGRYLLGIECDGATYHSSRSARDRDRIRQGVLESRGWKIHRIWSLDWFNDPERELLRLVESVADAKTASETAAATEVVDKTPHTKPEGSPAAVVRDSLDTESPTGGSLPYVVAGFSPPTMTTIPETPIGVIAESARQVVAIEGPVHGAEVARRLSQIWGSGRTGAKIQSQVSQAIDLLTQRGVLMREDAFLHVPGGGPDRIRDRTNAPSSVRKPEMLPPQEIALALKEVVEQGVGVGRDEAVKAAAVRLGFTTRRSPARDRIEQIYDALSNGLSPR